MSSILTNSRNVTINNGTFNAISTQTTTIAAPSTLEKLATAAANTALHNAPARTDTSRCLPGTRIKASRRLKRWARRTSRKARAIFWLKGGAGAGKSALMQTIAECLVAEGLVLGCFFFYRMDATRNRAGALVATLAYQLVQHFPLLKTFLDPLLDVDPMIFQKSFQHQFEHLLVKSLRYLIQEGLLTEASPRIFIIDGLDECIDRAEQRTIIQAVSTLHYLPVKFLIASRIEVDISTAFKTYAASHRFLQSMSLSDDTDAVRDIRRFLKDQFQTIRGDHPFRDIIPPDWPSDDQVSALVHKSSSHFVFPATAMRYISSPRESPVHALDVVLGLERTRTAESPFSEIDALYCHILESAAHRDKVLEIIRFCIFLKDPPTIWALSYVLGCSCDDIYIFLADMTPLINIRSDLRDPPPMRQVNIPHASLRDFLLDQQRSVFLYIDQEVLFANAIRQCYAVISSFIEDKHYWQTFQQWSTFKFNCATLVISIEAAIRETAWPGGVCGPVYDVLCQHNIRVFHDLSHCFSDDRVFPFAEDFVTTIEEANFRDSEKLLTQYLDDYAAIQEPYILYEISHIGPAILPLLYTGFSRQSLRVILDRVISHNWPLHPMVDTLFSRLHTPTFPKTRHIYDAAKSAAQGAEVILEYFTTFAAFRASTGSRPVSSSVLWEPPHKTWLRSHKSGTRAAMGSPVLARVFHDRCVAIMLEGFTSRFTYGPRSHPPKRFTSAKKYLKRVVEALPTVYACPNYEAPSPQGSYRALPTLFPNLYEPSPHVPIRLKYPAYDFDVFFSLHDYHLLEALIWLLPRAGFSDTLLHHSNRLTPRWTYLRWPKLSQRLRRALDDYRVRVTNERIKELSKRILAGDRDALIEKTRLLEVDALD